MESIVVWIIIGVTLFFLGRKLWRQWKAASGRGTFSCGCGCSCDGGSICPPRSNDTEGQR